MKPGARTVVIINDSATNNGGAAKLALTLATSLGEHGKHVAYIAGDDGENEALTVRDVHVTPVNGVSLLKAPIRSMLNGVYYKRARRLLCDYIEKHDDPETVYHVHSWAQILSPSIFAALKPVADRTVITAHDFFLACPNGNFSIYPKDKICPYDPLSVKCVLTNCDKRNYTHKIWRVARQVTLKSIANFPKTPFSYIAIAPGMETFLTPGGIPTERIHVIRNPGAGLTVERTTAEANKEIIFAGRLQREKGVDLLAAAAAKAGAPLRIFGDGPLLDEVRKINPEAVMEGWCAPEDIATAMTKARLVVMPSRCVEPFGLVAAEALSAGVPVLVSLSCLLGGEIEAAKMGEIVDIFDADRFASKLSALMLDDAAIRSMSENAMTFAGTLAQTDHDWVSAHVAFYDKMVGGP